MEAHPSAQSMPPLVEGSISISGALHCLSPSHLTPLEPRLARAARRKQWSKGRDAQVNEAAGFSASVIRSLSAQTSSELALPQEKARGDSADWLS